MEPVKKTCVLIIKFVDSTITGIMNIIYARIIQDVLQNCFPLLILAFWQLATTTRKKWDQQSFVEKWQIGL